MTRAVLLALVLALAGAACSDDPSSAPSTVESSPGKLDAADGAPLKVEQLLFAPVGGVCGTEADIALDNGQYPTSPNWLYVASATDHLAIGDLTGDGVDEGVSILQCTSAVGEPVIVLVYGPGPEVIARVPWELSMISERPPVVDSAEIIDRHVVLRARTFRRTDPKCCPSRFVSMRWRLERDRMVVETTPPFGEEVVSPGTLGAWTAGSTLDESALAANVFVDVDVSVEYDYRGMMTEPRVEDLDCFNVGFVGGYGLKGIGGAGKVMAISIESGDYLTEGGVGVGSTLEEVLDAHPEVEPYTDYGDGAPNRVLVRELSGGQTASLLFLVDVDTERVWSMVTGVGDWPLLMSGCMDVPVPEFAKVS